MMTKKPPRQLALLPTLLALGYLSSCSTSDPVQIEKDFGNSVRHMVEQQKQTPTTDQTSSVTTPTGLDGDSAMNSLELYRSAQRRRVHKESLDTFNLNE